MIVGRCQCPQTFTFAIKPNQLISRNWYSDFGHCLLLQIPVGSVPLPPIKDQMVG